MNTYGGFHKVGFSLKLKFEIWSQCVLFSILKRSVDKSGQRAKVHILYVVPTYRAYMYRYQVYVYNKCILPVRVYLYGANNDQRKGGEQ